MDHLEAIVYLIRVVKDVQIFSLFHNISRMFAFVQIVLGFSCIADDEGALAMKAIQNVMHHLKHIGAIWCDVLPTNVYFKSIGGCRLFNLFPHNYEDRIC